MVDRPFEAGRTADPYGWQRWSASLLAIHDVGRMTALDLPWWNVTATREVADFLAATKNSRVFEYGSGASTVWLARRAAEVISVEHDRDWHRIIEPLVAGTGNATVLPRDLQGSDYIDAIATAGGQFDLVVIDGRRRNDCLQSALPFLKPGGIVLFDDTSRSRYRVAIAGCGLRSHRHFGRSYCVPYPDSSTILYG
ncbi:MAG: class I SAM-dependent methyltransferase [Erythrobacter sp.]|nr:MAG: class I SAM-dependent methyltransferase [Erythrobacter sp.]